MTQFKLALMGGAAALALSALPALAQDMTACLITKTDTNPFFVKMKEGATAKAEELGITLKSYAGRIDGDSESQVAAIETCIADGAKGILITASDTKGIVPSVQKARDAGLLVIALDTPLDPIDAADGTFATDNFLAGELIGKWAKARMGDAAGDARIALLNLDVSQPSVDVLRNQGFLQGFGVELGDKTRWGDEDDPRIVGQEVTQGNEEGGRRAMESLLAQDPTINLVHTINEPAAARLRGAEIHRPRSGCADRLGRWRLPGRAERQGRRHRGHLAAISAADGGAGGRGHRGLRQGWHQARHQRGQGFHRYRRGAGDRPAGRGRRVHRQHQGAELCWG